MFILLSSFSIFSFSVYSGLSYRKVSMPKNCFLHCTCTVNGMALDPKCNGTKQLFLHPCRSDTVIPSSIQCYNYWFFKPPSTFTILTFSQGIMDFPKGTFGNQGQNDLELTCVQLLLVVHHLLLSELQHDVALLKYY